MKKKIIFLCAIIFIVSFIGCNGNSVKVNTKEEANIKQEIKTDGVELIMSDKSYKEMNGDEKNEVNEVLKKWDSQEENFKNEYTVRKEQIEKEKKEESEKMKGDLEKTNRSKEAMLKSIQGKN
ncbi:hypothetical protein JW813_13175 [Clostridium botulinum]|uniref:hypothetical protein n=1 Tax=Clostridium botulinum TaxID=1491 RepID=UPI002246137E|nr:hypothetical protein [Clostridium botulinum]UZP02655.1 hypothetical protein JW813_13175 [Clostridium botulinum]UZP06012.1 hypothetical protein JYA71_13440 [Clostridium botulinum]UZP09394.1 hypothetical protein JYA74_13170 [Clostridium botulinum]